MASIASAILLSSLAKKGILASAMFVFDVVVCLQPSSMVNRRERYFKAHKRIVSRSI